MNRRNALISLAALAACSPGPQDDFQVVVRELGGFELKPGEGSAVMASLKGSRYTVDVDPTVQPQSDFDPDAA
ncbi:MAG TPA: hypothetical protein VFA43_01610 [Gemmatimonadaceae bacterium]|nr:hypothetical protein [Gemmatimonadaceae bacterium]